MSTVFEEFERHSPSLDVLRKISFKSLCALSGSKEARRVVSAFLEGCCDNRAGPSMPSDCASVYLVGLRVAFFPRQIFKRPDCAREVELTGSARRMAAGVFALVAGSKKAGWRTLCDADPVERAAASANFFDYLWLHLDFVQWRRELERRRTLTALCVAHNARVVAANDSSVQRRCAKGIAALLPCFAKVKLGSDDEVFACIQSGSLVPIPGYPGDPALTAVPVRPFDGCNVHGLARLAYELLVDPAYRATLSPDFFDLFEEGSFFALGHDLVAPSPVVDYLLDIFDSMSEGVGRLCKCAGRPARAFLAPRESSLLAALIDRRPLAGFFQEHFDVLLELSTPPSFFAPEVGISESDAAFLELAGCSGELLPPHAAFVDRLTSLRSEWLQFTHPFPDPHTALEVTTLWIRTLRFLIWLRTSIEVEASNVRIGLLRPIIVQQLARVHTFVQAALFREHGSSSDVDAFSAWRLAYVGEDDTITVETAQTRVRLGVLGVVLPSSCVVCSTPMVVFPAFPPQLGVDDLPLPLRFDCARLSRIRSRVESAVVVSTLLRTLEYAFDALDPPSAPARLHACYSAIQG
jgi:hypothetical protein